jgi:uncharacterized membrane protein
VINIHILAGILALAAAMTALYTAKGSALHRQSGLVAVITLLGMAGSGALMAVFVVPDGVNVVAGLLTAYLVGTAFLTVQRGPVGELRELHIGLMLAAFVLGAAAIGLGLEALNRPDDWTHNLPWPWLFVYGAIGVAGGSLDALQLWAGQFRGTGRLARHAWRMGAAIFITTASFFLGQAQVFPEPVRRSGVLVFPVLLALLVPVYWLLKLLIKGQRAVPR